MKAILTRYLGPTNTKPSRIIASDLDKNRVTVSYRAGLNSDENHKAAAEALKAKMGWTGTIMGGAIDSDTIAWVFVDRGPGVMNFDLPRFETTRILDA